MKWTIGLVVLAAALSVTLTAQTLTEQLQKGIYTEETLGDRVEAARIYRQIIAAPAVPRTIAQEAERRLARLTASQRPGGPGGAVFSQPGQPPTIFRGQPPMIVGHEKRGVVENIRYRHFSSGITFDLPPGWTASETFPSSDGGDMVTLTEGATRRSIDVWMIKEETPPAQLAARIAGAPIEKLRQRHSGYSIPGMFDDRTYDIPQETVRPTSINGRDAMVAMGRYIGTAGQPMIEYMTWIYTMDSRAFFFARVPVDDVPLLRPSFEMLVNSAVVP
jgi:hypothetical protein